MAAKSKPSLFGYAAKFSWVVTALASLNLGLLPFGYNFFQSPLFINNLSNFGPAFHYIIGLCGLFSLVTFAMHCSDNCKSC